MRRLRGGVTQRAGRHDEPSAALFRAIRRRLTLLYTTILAVMLILSGVILYVNVRNSLLGPIDQYLHVNAAGFVTKWQLEATQLPVQFPCAQDPHFAPHDVLFACYSPDGRQLSGTQFGEGAGNFDDPTLVQSAISNGSASDIVDGGTFGSVRRYAVAVPGANGKGVVGVIQVGDAVGAQLDALDTLLHWLLGLGFLTILLAGVGGWVLANRALLPARLAYSRQRDFIADASHELRTPLTMLRSNVEVVLRGRKSLPEDDVELLEDTVKEVAHMTALANTMLDLARLDADEVRLERDVVDLREIGADVARWAGPLAAEHGIQVHTTFAGPVLVLGDRVLLEQTALILVDNAIKYNRSEGNVTVRVWTNDGRANLEVRDTGIGIAPEHLGHLGERFYRVDKARSREAGGAGLGVSIAQRIAALHRGVLELSSETGTGTTARLSLPALRTTGTPQEAVGSTAE